MHGLTAGIAKRLRALELRLGTIPTTETDAETARRLTLVRAAHLDHEPEDLQEDERPVFSKIKATVYIARELQGDGLVDAYLVDEHDDGHHPDLHRDEDEDGDDFGELVWRP